MKLPKTLEIKKKDFYSKTLKLQNYFRIDKFTYKKIIKALSVVCDDALICTTDRGLHFLRNWFKNKIPHHPAPHM